MLNEIVKYGLQLTQIFSSLSSQDVSSQRNLGAILHLNGKLEEALHHYEVALSLAPGDPQTTTNLKRLKALLSKKGLL